jgi:hypothetical protein
MLANRYAIVEAVEATLETAEAIPSAAGPGSCGYAASVHTLARGLMGIAQGHACSRNPSRAEPMRQNATNGRSPALIAGLPTESKPT